MDTELIKIIEEIERRYPMTKERRSNLLMIQSQYGRLPCLFIKEGKIEVFSKKILNKMKILLFPLCG